MRIFAATLTPGAIVAPGREARSHAGTPERSCRPVCGVVAPERQVPLWARPLHRKLDVGILFVQELLPHRRRTIQTSLRMPHSDRHRESESSS